MGIVRTAAVSMTPIRARHGPRFGGTKGYDLCNHAQLSAHGTVATCPIFSYGPLSDHGARLSWPLRACPGPRYSQCMVRTPTHSCNHLYHSVKPVLWAPHCRLCGTFCHFTP